MRVIPGLTMHVIPDLIPLHVIPGLTRNLLHVFPDLIGDLFLYI